MQKTITIAGKRYTGKQIIKGLAFNPENYTYWFEGTYVVPRGYESDTSMRPGPERDPSEARFVEVGHPYEGATKMLTV